MRRVKRGPQPTSLKRHGNNWTRALQTEIVRCAPTQERVDDKFFNEYKRPDIREALRGMYRNLCCYCEGQINLVSYDHIEHRKPKRRFPDEAYSWSNLHLACEKCNKKKGAKWKESAPILDASIDPIEEHLTYEEGDTGLRRWPANKSKRGDTTIRHTDLNRGDMDELPGARARVYMECLKTIRRINTAERQDRGSPEARASLEELLAKAQGQFGSVIVWALDQFLADSLKTTAATP